MAAGKTPTVRETLKLLTLIQPPCGRLRITGGEEFAAVSIKDKYMGHVGELDDFNQGLLPNQPQWRRRGKRRWLTRDS